MRCHFLLLSVACIQCAACASEDRAPGWAGTVTDSLGISVVRNPASGMWPDGEGWSLVEELRVGSLDGESDYQFGQIGTIALNSVGDILVSDRQTREVRVFSGDGTFLRSFGSPGSGPGELSRSFSDILVTDGDTLIVPDVQNRRISRFGPDGGILGSVPIAPSRTRPLRFEMNPSMSAMAVQLRPAVQQDSENIPMDAIQVIEPSGEFGATLLEVPSGGLFAGQGIRYFTPEPMWDITDSLTVVYGVNSEYRIGSYARDGSLQRVTTKAFEPRLIGDRDIRAFFAYLDRAWLNNGVPATRLAENHARVSFAEFFPAYATFQTGPGGTLWVQPVQSPADLTDAEIERYNFLEDFGAPVWDVFDNEGHFLGVVEMPKRFQPRLFAGEKIYGVWRDELDVQHLMRLRIVQAP